MKYRSFNDSSLINHFNGDEEILLDMIVIFKDKLAALLDPIRESIFTRNAEQLRINAHIFKGVMGNFYSEEGRELAFELEKRGKESSFDGALELLNKLENLLQMLLFELKSLVETLQTHK